MSSQIRITKTTELEKVLNYLRAKWVLMDEVEIVKMAINEFWMNSQNLSQNHELIQDNDPLGTVQSIRDLKDGKFTTLNNSQQIKDHFNSL